VDWLTWIFPGPAILRALNRIEERQEIIMSGLDDLNTAVQQLQDNVGALQNEQAQFIIDIQQALQNNAGDSDAAVEAVAQLVTAQAQNVASLTSGQQAADPNQPAPPASS
jgi:hypothetical protein